MTRTEVLDRLPIRPSDFVVEIGAGPAPFRHTKLILEKYPFDNEERHGDIVNLAPVIKADAAKLPLADQSCDVLFASHVIEHLDEPGRLVEEAKRVARNVYLEFPTAARELMYAWSFHKWLVEAEGNRLVFYRNDIPQLFGDFFHAEYDFLFDTWSQERFEELNGFLYAPVEEVTWTVSPRTALEHVLARGRNGGHKINFPSQYGRTGTGSVAYPMATCAKMIAWALTPSSLIRARNRLAQRRNRRARQPLVEPLLARLVCQRCRTGGLQHRGGSGAGEIVCPACGEHYAATDGVFDFDR